MSNAADTEPMRPQGSAPVRTAAVVIYVTLALLVLTIPQSLVNWVHDMEEKPVQLVLLQAASGVQAASRAAGLDIPYRRARAAFHAWTGKEDE